MLVALGFIVGIEFARARAQQLGIAVADVVDGGLFIVGMGFVVGHFVHVGVYNPHLIDEYGWSIMLQIWAGFSSNGGFVGAILGTVLWFKVVRNESLFGNMPIPLLIHYHLGGSLDDWGAFPHMITLDNAVISSWQWTSLPSIMAVQEHDLGFYEALWVFCLAIVHFSLRNKSLPHSTFAMIFCFAYAPVRFGLDFLRNTDLSGADVRFLGLTPLNTVPYCSLCVE